MSAQKRAGQAVVLGARSRSGFWDFEKPGPPPRQVLSRNVASWPNFYLVLAGQ